MAMDGRSATVVAHFTIDSHRYTQTHNVYTYAYKMVAV